MISLSYSSDFSNITEVVRSDHERLHVRDDYNVMYIAMKLSEKSPQQAFEDTMTMSPALTLFTEYQTTPSQISGG